jgi:membrane protease YdiL (CAAX protease family)
MRPFSPILIFNIITFSFTWTVAGLIYFQINVPTFDVRAQILHSLGALGPTLGAFSAAYWFYGGKGVVALFRSLGVSWRPFAQSLPIILSPLFLFIIGICTYRLIKGAWFDFGGFIDSYWSSLIYFLVWFLPLVSYAVLEEFGWRGFLLPLLQEKYSAWQSTIYLTLIWGAWHIPFFFYRFEFSPFISIGFFFGLFVGAIILTHLYNVGRGSLLPVILFHLLMNIGSGFDEEIIVAVLSTGYVFIAMNIYQRYGKKDLSPAPRVQNYFSKG